jgi:hypothetical protein
MSEIKDPIFYNKASANMLGWLPEWFGASEFNETLTEAIKNYQTNNNLRADGLCGPNTFRSINNDRQLKFELVKQKFESKSLNLEQKNYIVNGSNSFEIPWDKFIGLYSGKPLAASEKNIRPRHGHPINMIVCHHDVCLTSHDCFKVLERRGLSIGFLIDYDGTIYQSTDLQYSAQHCGNINSYSVGIEVCNPIETKYNSYYTSKGLPSRPIVKSQTFHGHKYKNFLGLYPIQIEALKVLLKALSTGLNIPLDTPLDKDGNGLYEVSSEVQNCTYRGIVGHYHQNKEKWDIAGIDLKSLVESLK